LAQVRLISFTAHSSLSSSPRGGRCLDRWEMGNGSSSKTSSSPEGEPRHVRFVDEGSSGNGVRTSPVHLLSDDGLGRPDNLALPLRSISEPVQKGGGLCEDDCQDHARSNGSGSNKSSLSPTKRAGSRRSLPSTPISPAFGDLLPGHLLKHRRWRAKSPETLRRLRDGIRHDRFCAWLEENDVQMILDNMEFYEFRSGEVVVREGEVGSHYFVTHSGSLEVKIKDQLVDTMLPGTAFGGISLLCGCPHTQTVTASEASCVWGAKGSTFQKVLSERTDKHHDEMYVCLSSIQIFQGLQPKQLEHICNAMVLEVVEAGARVVTEGEAPTGLYFVKEGSLHIVSGASDEVVQLGPGDSFGESALLNDQPQDATVEATTRCELCCIDPKSLKQALGTNLRSYLELNHILLGLHGSRVFSHFSPPEQLAIARAMEVKDYGPGEALEGEVTLAVVMKGSLERAGKSASSSSDLGRRCSGVHLLGEDAIAAVAWAKEESASLSASSKALHAHLAEEIIKSIGLSRSISSYRAGRDESLKHELDGLVMGPEGARLGVLTEEALVKALRKLAAASSPRDVPDYTRRMVLLKKVPIFRHLSHQQMDNLVKVLQLHNYKKGDDVITEGEIGGTFFLLDSGEVDVFMEGKFKRSLGRFEHFGERALLLSERRGATVRVSSAQAALWSIDKSTFMSLLEGRIRQELLHLIELQDTQVTLKDLRHLRVIGSGSSGVVRLVEHVKTRKQYALKRVHKVSRQVPSTVQRECEILNGIDHPFIMHLVKTLETRRCVYMLTEMIAGGELFSAIRRVPDVLSTAQAQFYIGSLLLVLEALSDKRIVYRDLKPENVMLDNQGYCKLIDFGGAKKFPEGKNMTFTHVGTPHYMAPEVIYGARGYGMEVDLWSMGVILFELVCGYLPFGDADDEVSAVYRAVLQDKLVFPDTYTEEAGRELVRGLLESRPKHRAGSGAGGFHELKMMSFFNEGHEYPEALFNKIIGRELDPPIAPDTDFANRSISNVKLEVELSDAGELWEAERRSGCLGRATFLSCIADGRGWD